MYVETHLIQQLGLADLLVDIERVRSDVIYLREKDEKPRWSDELTTLRSITERRSAGDFTGNDSSIVDLRSSLHVGVMGGTPTVDRPETIGLSDDEWEQLSNYLRCFEEPTAMDRADLERLDDLLGRLSDGVVELSTRRRDRLESAVGPPG